MLARAPRPTPIVASSSHHPATIARRFELLLAARLQKQICLLAPLHPEAAGDKLATLEG